MFYFFVFRHYTCYDGEWQQPDPVRKEIATHTCNIVQRSPIIFFKTIQVSPSKFVVPYSKQVSFFHHFPVFVVRTGKLKRNYASYNKKFREKEFQFSS